MGDDMIKDFEGMTAAVQYFSENSDRIPALLQLKFIVETLAYAQKIKPLYVMALTLRGDVEHEEGEDNE